MAGAVITGVGAVTPLGVGAETLISRWVRGDCGLVDGRGECRDFEVSDFLSSQERRRADRSTQLALAAADEAISHAGWEELPYPPDRIGCIIGTAVGGIATTETAAGVVRDRGSDRVSPFTIPSLMPNAAAGQVAIRHGLQGATFGVVSACAAGSHAIGTALGLLASGEMDAVVAGGCECAMSPVPTAAFAVMGATSKTGISRPFDRRRDGFVLGEGAGLLVLENAESARARGATELGEIIGYAATSDAYHITAPTEGGEMPALAITRALESADLAPEDVDYVNAHGTSTPLNDRAETVAIKRALSDHAYKIPVSSTKSVIGHLLGAAGAVEAIATVLALQRRLAPPTVGYEEPEEDLDLNYVPDQAQPLPDRDLVAINNSFGFGGHNAVMAIRSRTTTSLERGD